MSLFNKLKQDDNFLDWFCQLLEETISEKKGSSVDVLTKRLDESIFFFIDGSSILQIVPSKDLKYTYAHRPGYENEIQVTMNIAEKQYNRDLKIDKIIE